VLAVCGFGGLWFWRCARQCAFVRRPASGSGRRPRVPRLESPPVFRSAVTYAILASSGKRATARALSLVAGCVSPRHALCKAVGIGGLVCVSIVISGSVVMPSAISIAPLVRDYGSRFALAPLVSAGISRQMRPADSMSAGLRRVVRRAPTLSRWIRQAGQSVDESRQIVAPGHWRLCQQKAVWLTNTVADPLFF
jgi:hypothetical protein